MQAMVLARNPDVLMYKGIHHPTPGKHQAPADVQVFGVNHRNVYEREGHGLYSANPPEVIRELIRQAR